jgi:hypothetical protein
LLGSYFSLKNKKELGFFRVQIMVFERVKKSTANITRIAFRIQMYWRPTGWAFNINGGLKIHKK